MPERYRSSFTFEGKRYYAESTKGQREADRKADSLKLKLERGEVGISGHMTVKAWAHEWLETYKRPSVGDKHYRMYKTNIDKVLTPELGATPVKNVKDIQLQRILNSRTGNSKSDIDKLYLTINSIFYRAYASGIIPKNPAEFLEKPKGTENSHRSITLEERKIMLEVSETHRAGLWIKLMLYCGLRPGECRALEWRHVDFDKRLIHIKQAMKASSREIGAPKSAAGIRDVPIPDVFYPDLFAEKDSLFAPVLRRETPMLRHSESSMRVMWKSFLRTLDIAMGAKLYRNKIVLSAVAPDVEPYCLRHTYCTDLQDKGVPINVAKYFMGHSDISLTARIYTHTTELAIQNAADLINGVGGGVGKASSGRINN